MGIVRTALETGVAASVALGSIFLVGAGCDCVWRAAYRETVEPRTAQLPRVVLVLPEGDGYQLEARSRGTRSSDWLLLDERRPAFDAHRIGQAHELTIPATAEVVMVTVKPARASRMGDLDE